jgi:hypothetical protein
LGGLGSQLLVDDRLEVLERLGAIQEPAVDEERRSPLHTDLLSFLVVLHHVRPELAGVVAAIEGLGVEFYLSRVLLQVVVGQGALVGENLVVVFPELALGVRALRGFGRGLRPVV